MVTRCTNTQSLERCQLADDHNDRNQCRDRERLIADADGDAEAALEEATIQRAAGENRIFGSIEISKMSETSKSGGIGKLFRIFAIFEITKKRYGRVGGIGEKRPIPIWNNGSPAIFCPGDIFLTEVTGTFLLVFSTKTGARQLETN